MGCTPLKYRTNTVEDTASYHLVSRDNIQKTPPEEKESLSPGGDTDYIVIHMDASALFHDLHNLFCTGLQGNSNLCTSGKADYGILAFGLHITC